MKLSLAVLTKYVLKRKEFKVVPTLPTDINRHIYLYICLFIYRLFLCLFWSAVRVPFEVALFSLHHHKTLVTEIYRQRTGWINDVIGVLVFACFEKQQNIGTCSKK